MSSMRQTSRRFGYIALQPNNVSGSNLHGAMLADGLDRLFIDVIQPDGRRSERDAAIATAGAGDVIVTPTLEMMAGSVAELVTLNASIEAKGAFLVILQVAGGLSLDTRLPEGRAILGALAVMHTLEDSARASRSRDPQAVAAQAETPQVVIRGRGRPPTAIEKSDEIVKLYAQGVRAVDIATRLGIGRASVYRMLSQELPPAAPPISAPAASAPRRALDVADRVRGKALTGRD